MPQPHVAQPAAITIGNFDGVHVGHAALVAAARRAVGQSGRVVVQSFDPNPLEILRSESAPPRLTTFAQRSRWLKQLGADEVVRIEPTHEFLRQTPEQFIEGCVKEWRPAFIVEGADFRFGRGRAGSIDTLKHLESRFGYRTIVVEPVEIALIDQSLVRASSSLIRWLLAHGRVQDAAIALGRLYEIEAKVIRGDQRGRTLGFPTANLDATDQMLPADGIYAGVAEREGTGQWPAAISIGTKPTFGRHSRICEAHVLDYDGPVDDYDWPIRLRFTHWLRDQLTFDGADALIAQLRRDVEATRALAPAQQSSGMAIPGLSRTRWERAG